MMRPTDDQLEFHEVTDTIMSAVRPPTHAKAVAAAKPVGWEDGK